MSVSYKDHLGKESILHLLSRISKSAKLNKLGDSSRKAVIEHQNKLELFKEQHDFDCEKKHIIDELDEKRENVWKN